MCVCVCVCVCARARCVRACAATNGVKAMCNYGSRVSGYNTDAYSQSLLLYK